MQDYGLWLLFLKALHVQIVTLHCPYRSICSNLLILTLSLLFNSLACLTQVPPVVQSIFCISTYLLHSALYAPFFPTPTTLRVVQSTHSPIMQQPQWPSNIFPIPSVAGTLASHFLLVLSQVFFLPVTLYTAFLSFGSTTQFLFELNLENETLFTSFFFVFVFVYSITGISHRFFSAETIIVSHIIKLCHISSRSSQFCHYHYHHVICSSLYVTPFVFDCGQLLQCNNLIIISLPLCMS